MRILRKLAAYVKAFLAPRVTAIALARENISLTQQATKLLREKELAEGELEITQKKLDEVKRELSQSEARLEVAELQNAALVLAHKELTARLEASIAIKTARKMEVINQSLRDEV